MKPLSITTLRYICFIEAISYLVLLFVAMPLKYLKGEPHLVSLVGALHGGLFVAFLFSLIIASVICRWHIKYPAALFIASIIPFAPFFFEKWFQKEISAAKVQA